MPAGKFEKLLVRAHRAFGKKKFALAEKYWAQALILNPDDARVTCNLAMAKMELGALDEALACFAEAIRKDTRCARAYNNRAALLFAMGAPLEVVLPSFIMALELSESYEDFGRHAINVCRTVAFTFDPAKSLVFDEMEGHILRVSQRFKPQSPSIEKTLATFWPQFLFAYRQVAVYRTSLGAKHWLESDQALENARQTFADIGLDNFSEELRSHRRIFDFTRRVYEYLEEIGSAQGVALEVAWGRSMELHDQAKAILDEEESQREHPLLHAMGWFLMLLTEQLGVLAGKSAERPKIEEQLQIWLQTGPFPKIGHEFIGILNFADQRLQSFMDATRAVASRATVDLRKDEEWTRIALFINGQILGFADIEAAVARSILGGGTDAVQKIRTELTEFRTFIERQAYRDIFVNGSPMENIARTLLQSRLSARSYREVPTRAGRSDILAFVGNGGRVLIETKIWRGPDYHEKGVKELAEYVAGEGDDGKLLGAFYVIFDPTVGQCAAAHEGGPIAVRKIAGFTVEVLMISLCPPTPSRKR